MKTVFFLFFLINVKVQPLIPSIDDLPKDCCYFKNYYMNFSQWFNNNIYSWSKSRDFKLKLDNIKHWYISPITRKQFYYSWGVGWDPKLEKAFYTISEAITKDETKTLSTNKDYECTQKENKLLCHKKIYNLSRSSTMIPKNFPLTSNGEFYFKSFVTDSKYYFEDKKLKRVYFKLNNVQVNWLPKQLQTLIQKIGLESRLPVDRISIDSEGIIMVYYP